MEPDCDDAALPAAPPAPAPASRLHAAAATTPLTPRTDVAFAAVVAGSRTFFSVAERGERVVVGYLRDSLRKIVTSEE